MIPVTFEVAEFVGLVNAVLSGGLIMLGLDGRDTEPRGKVTPSSLACGSSPAS